MAYRLILGSASPRRKELLSGLDVIFTVDTGNNFIEQYPEDTKAEDIPSFLSKGKSLGFHRELEDDELLLTSDTLVLCPDESGNYLPMGKPKSQEAAREMLEKLSGKSHKVITAITLRSKTRMETISDTATVHFKDLSEDEISYYIEHYKPFDKAGAYGIQEWIGYIGISQIEGSFYTIMGLPVHSVYEMLKKFNFFSK